VGGRAPLHLRRRRGRSAPRQPDGPLAPDEHWLELRLPKALEHLANRPGGRYRLSCPVVFAYRGEEVAAQAESGAVRYDVFFDPGKHRWYLDASWSFSDGEPRPDMEHLRSGPVIAVDLNHGHLAVCVLDPSGTRSERR